MASPTKKVKIRRAINKARMARKRKNRMNKLGTTAPSLVLNRPNANERAQHQKG